MPTLVILMGNDNAKDHAVTAMYQDMIFDLLHQYILKRCTESLDWCCAPLGFQQIHRAYSLSEVVNMNKRQKLN